MISSFLFDTSGTQHQYGGLVKDKSLRQRCDELLAQLKSIRLPYEPVWREIGENVKPMRPRWMVDDEGQVRLSDKIIDPTATLASRTCESGMMNGLTSPSKPWFAAVVPDYTLEEDPDADAWLYHVTDAMRRVFAQSNLYNELTGVYSDMPDFGIGGMLGDDDERDIVRFDSLPIGTYYIGNDHRKQVSQFGREYPFNARQIVHQFGMMPNGRINFANISENVQSAYESGNTEQKFVIRHVIYENDSYDPKSPYAEHKKFLSVTYEAVCENDKKILKKSGYDIFPGWFPRWARFGQDVYGSLWPALISIQDIKQLQHGTKRKLEAIDKKVRPPVEAHMSMKVRGVFTKANMANYTTDPSGKGMIRPVYMVDLSIKELEEELQQVRHRIQRSYYEDVFLMLATREGVQPLNDREVNELSGEKLLVLGSLYERLAQDLLDPLFDFTFAKMLKRGLIPPPPPILQGREVKAEYLSIMAQAQKMIGLGTVERFANFAGAVVQLFPESRFKVNSDQALDVYANAVSLPPQIIRTDEEAAMLREQSQQQVAAQQQMEMVEQGSAAAKNLAQADMETDNALTQLAGGA